MNLSYRRDKDHNYMVLDAPGKLTGTEYQIRMIVSNRIPHLLKCNMRMIDGKAVFYYEITGMQPMFRTFEKTALNQADIIGILLDIKKALENVEGYLLEGNELIFEAECLFFDIQTRKWHMCYLPSYGGDMAEGFRGLAEYILKKLDHSDEKAVLLGYDVYSRASEENYKLSEILQIVYQNRDKDMDIKKADEEQVYEEQVFEERSFEEPIYEEKSYQEQPYERQKEEKNHQEENKQICKEKEINNDNINAAVSKHKRQKVQKKDRRSKNIKYILYAIFIIFIFGITALLVVSGMINIAQAGGVLFLAAGIFIYVVSIKAEDIRDCFQKKRKKNTYDDFTEEARTCVMREGDSICMAILISVRPQEYGNALLFKEEMHIGKEERQADICIPCDVISRIHAKIVRMEDCYYLTDLGSTNGTYINGKRIPENEPVKLEQGDMLAFANVEYIFQLQNS